MVVAGAETSTSMSAGRLTPSALCRVGLRRPTRGCRCILRCSSVGIRVSIRMFMLSGPVMVSIMTVDLTGTFSEPMRQLQMRNFVTATMPPRTGVMPSVKQLSLVPSMFEMSDDSVQSMILTVNYSKKQMVRLELKFLAVFVDRAYMTGMVKMTSRVSIMSTMSIMTEARPSVHLVVVPSFCPSPIDTHIGKKDATSTLFTMSLQSRPGRPPVMAQVSVRFRVLTVYVRMEAWKNFATCLTTMRTSMTPEDRLVSPLILVLLLVSVARLLTLLRPSVMVSFLGGPRSIHRAQGWYVGVWFGVVCPYGTFVCVCLGGLYAYVNC